MATGRWGRPIPSRTHIRQMALIDAIIVVLVLYMLDWTICDNPWRKK